MKYPVSVLRGAHRSRKVINTDTATPSKQSRLGISCEQPVNSNPATMPQEVIQRLCPVIHPVIRNRVEALLASEDPPTKALLGAWSRIGRADAGRPARAHVSAAGATTMTPLGVACLVAYAQAYEDETQARAVEAAAEGDSSGSREGGRSKCPRPGRAR